MSNFGHLAEALLLLRRRANLTQDEAARRAGVSQSQLSKYELGRSTPTFETADRILAAVNADVHLLARALDAAERKEDRLAPSGSSGGQEGQQVIVQMPAPAPGITREDFDGFKEEMRGYLSDLEERVRPRSAEDAGKPPTPERVAPRTKRGREHGG